LDQRGDLVLRQPGHEQPPSTGARNIPWASALRVAVGTILIAVLFRSSILLLVGLAAQSDRWHLPNGQLLEGILSSCQFEHSRRAGIDAEQMICPTRLAAHDFPRVLRDAVIASEDERFFSHGAVDFRSSMRAAWHSISGDRQGGSTITQQLARSLLLRKEDSFERKLLEAVLAVRIFAMLPRAEILTRYLNAVPHARNMTGFDDPARYYFGVGAQDLSLAEAALLVGMLPEPNNRDPLKAPSDAFDAAVGVLQRMRQQDKITEDQAAEAEQELRRRVLSGNLRRGDQAYARIEYRPYRDLALREAQAYGIALSGDYRLIVFLDAEFQQNLLAQICSITGQHQAAGFFMRPSGEVLATAGSCRYTGAWNRASDIERSIGSTGKLFPLIGVHETAISLKYPVSTRPLGKPNWPAEPNSRCLARSKVRLDFALTYSCNRPWAEMAKRLGPRLDDIIKRFDITAPKSAALVPLGGINTSPMKLTRAYATLRNGGVLPQIRFVRAVIGPKGNVIVIPAPRAERRALSPATASAVLKDLRGPVKRGTARAANSLHALVYGKTGTSSRNLDALFVGLTQDFVGSLWLGHDKPAPMPGVHGGGTPALAFAKLTDFYYLRLAQARFLQRQEEIAGGEWGRLRSLAPREPTIRKLAILGSMGMSCWLLALMFRRRKQQAEAAPAERPRSAMAPGSAAIQFPSVTFPSAVVPFNTLPSPAGPHETR
jgi:penicillin-binding protein 1A